MSFSLSVAESCVPWPIASVADDGVTLTDATGAGLGVGVGVGSVVVGAVTVIAEDALRPLAVAVMLVLPAAPPVTSPLADTEPVALPPS